MSRPRLTPYTAPEPAGLGLGIDALSGTVAAPVPLPRGLSADTKLRGDLGPADAKADSAVNECIELGLCFVSCRPTSFEPL